MNGLVFYFLLAPLPFLQSCFVPLAECWILKQFETCYILFEIRSLVKEKLIFSIVNSSWCFMCYWPNYKYTDQ